VLLALSFQTICTFTVPDPEPARFGCLVPREALDRGLDIRGSKGRFQWRPLFGGDGGPAGSRRIWVEVAVAGVAGRRTLALGGQPPAGLEGAVYTRTDAVEEGVQMRRWRYAGGTVAWRALRRGGAVTAQEAGGEDEGPPGAGEELEPGELRVEHSAGFHSVFQRVAIAPREWGRMGLIGACDLDPARREHLHRAVRTMRQLPGPRGRGDYARGPEGEVVTNLEYDTTLALVGMGLATGDPDLVRRAWESAWHTVTVDRDGRTGLVFSHGRDHRTGRPEPGHVWLTGVLLVGCVTADADLIDAAGSIARSLVKHPPMGEGWQQRARDYGWPLWEVENYLAFAPEESGLVQGADRMATMLMDRFEEPWGVFRFGEGESGRGYTERAWITGGILLPALEQHLRRRRVPRGMAILRRARECMLRVVLDGRKGMPARYRIDVDGGQVYGRSATVEDPRSWMMLEGFHRRDRRRCLGRRIIEEALGELPVPGDPSLATTWTMVARNRWVTGLQFDLGR